MFVPAILSFFIAAGLTHGAAVWSKIGSDIGHPSARADTIAPTPIELTANSRRPNVPLPEKISDSTKTLLQFMTIWEQAELSIIAGVIDQASKDTNSSSPWTNDEVVHILEVHQAEAELHISYYIDLLKHYQVALIPEPCTYIDLSSPTSTGILGLEQLATLFIDALSDATKTLVTSGDSALLPIISSIVASKAEQAAFYRLFNNDNPSERAFLTAIPPALAYSTFLQVIESCPFDVNALGLTTSGVMFSDWLKVNETRTYCVDLAKEHIPSDLSKLSLNIIVGDQVPITVIPRNVELNGTVLAFDADFPRKEQILEGMVIAELTKEVVSGAADDLVKSSLATSFIQFSEPLVAGLPPAGIDGASCPRVGGNQV